MTREIPVSGGYVTLVDDADFEAIGWRKWSMSGSPEKGLYPVATIGGRLVRLHRYLLDAPPHLYVDHINGDTLDNRRCNLRLATHRQNSRNRRSHGREGLKGVQLRVKRWLAAISVDGKTIRLGGFPTAALAARAYDAAAREHFGQFAALNYPAGRDWLIPGEVVGQWPPVAKRARAEIQRQRGAQ